jgi:hypothetical protein
MAIRASTISSIGSPILRGLQFLRLVREKLEMSLVSLHYTICFKAYDSSDRSVFAIRPRFLILRNAPARIAGGSPLL